MFVRFHCLIAHVPRTVDDFGFKSKADSDMSASLQSFEKIDFKEVQHIPPYSPQQRRDALTQEWMRFLRNHGNIESDLPRTVWEFTFVSRTCLLRPPQEVS